MKIFDATAIIAFLSEMKCPESLYELSKYYKLIISEGVFKEIRKPPGKAILQDMINRKIIELVKVDIDKVTQIQNEYPQLHLGECEAITFAMLQKEQKNLYILSEDLKARKIFQNFNFSWTEQLLDVMKEKGIVNASIYKEKIDNLRKSPFYSSERRS